MKLPALLLGGVVIGSTLAAGAVHFFTMVVVAVATFAIAAFVLHRSAQGGARLSVPLPALFFAAVAFYTLLQSVPLPMAWLRALAPSTADVWDRCLLPFGVTGRSWASLSLDPGASSLEALKWATYAAVFVVSSSVAARRGASTGVLTVFVSALVAAFVTLVHGLVGATSLYGIYQPGFNTVPWHVGPLLNTNNLAGYLNVGILCGLGLMLTHRPLVPRWLIGMGTAVIIGVDVISASRGGVLALPVAVIALGLLLRRRRHDHGHGTSAQAASTWLMVFALAGGGVLAMLGGNYKAWAELYDKNLSKLEMMVWAKPMIADHPVFGIGRGAFESVFPKYRITPGNIVYTHAENFIAQWVAEWGLPFGILALIAFAWVFAPGRLGVRKSSLAAGAFCGVGALLLQNMVDLALEVPAVCIAVASLLGALWGDSRRHRRRGETRTRGPVSPMQARAAAFAVGLLGVLLATLTVVRGRNDITADRAAIHESLEGQLAFTTEAVSSLRARLYAAMERHPAEPYFPLVGALLAFQVRDQNPIPWIQRTLERAQVNGRAHLLLGEVLASRGAKRQALLELRLAVQDDPVLTGPAVRFATRWTRAFEELLLAVPDGKEGGATLSIMGAVLESMDAPLVRGQCDREALMRSPDLVGPRFREARARISAMAKGSTSRLCEDRSRCRSEVLEYADAIALLDPESSLAAQLRAGLLVVDDRALEAAHTLSVACERASDRVSCLSALVVAAAAVKTSDLLTPAAKELLAVGCSTPVACADLATWIGDVRTGRGERGMALVLYSRAAREDPNNEKRWLKLADMAAQAGAHAQAAEALEKVARQRGGADPALQKRIEEQRSLALGGLYAPKP